MTRWLTSFLARHTPSCKEIIQLISNSMERPPSLRQRLSIRFHFLICKWCFRYQKQIRFIHNILGGNPEKVGETAPGALPPEAQERIKQALRPKSK